MSRLWTDGRTTECEDRARILDTEFAILTQRWIYEHAETQKPEKCFLTKDIPEVFTITHNALYTGRGCHCSSPAEYQRFSFQLSGL